MSSNENDPVEDQSQILTRLSANQDNNGTNIIPALIQTSCLSKASFMRKIHFKRSRRSRFYSSEFTSNFL